MFYSDNRILMFLSLVSIYLTILMALFSYGYHEAIIHFMLRLNHMISQILLSILVIFISILHFFMITILYLSMAYY